MHLGSSHRARRLRTRSAALRPTTEYAPICVPQATMLCQSFDFQERPSDPCARDDGRKKITACPPRLTRRPDTWGPLSSSSSRRRPATANTSPAPLSYSCASRSASALRQGPERGSADRRGRRAACGTRERHTCLDRGVDPARAGGGGPYPAQPIRGSARAPGPFQQLLEHVRAALSAVWARLTVRGPLSLLRQVVPISRV